MGKYISFAGWNEFPHLTEPMKAEFRKAILPHERLAREFGIPYLGAGAIYPVPLSDILEEAFVIPDHFPRGFALDVGWKRTAALWGALDRDSDILHLYSEHYAGKEEPALHASAIMGTAEGKTRAKWIPGVIDPAGRGRSQKDGQRLMTAYSDLGLNLEISGNAVEAGIHEVWMRLSTGRIKVFKHLTNFCQEYGLYHRDENGKIVKKHDHLMDCLRMLILSGIERMVPVPAKNTMGSNSFAFHGSQNSWMGA